MSYPKILSLPFGKIGFAGSDRGVDEIDHRAFEIILADNKSMYGEWRLLFAKNESDFDIEIVNFGYWYKSNLGNEHPDARRRLSDAEILIIVGLIEALFKDEEALAQVTPFDRHRDRFGKLIYRAGWVA